MVAVPFACKGLILLTVLDEINRTPPKPGCIARDYGGRQVTAAVKHPHSEQPFFVLATQNPIEQRNLSS